MCAIWKLNVWCLLKYHVNNLVYRRADIQTHRQMDELTDVAHFSVPCIRCCQSGGGQLNVTYLRNPESRQFLLQKPWIYWPATSMSLSLLSAHLLTCPDSTAINSRATYKNINGGILSIVMHFSLTWAGRVELTVTLSHLKVVEFKVSYSNSTDSYLDIGQSINYPPTIG